jgi:tetratricopeptide (TPR) repeat protein
MNTDFQFSIFLSYSWKDTNVADEIERDLTNVGLRFLRDVHDIDYKGSIKEFMQKINSTDYVLILISSTYLKSPNCMYEVLELLENPDYVNRILPILIKDLDGKGPDIFNAQGKLKLIRHWETEIENLNKELKGLDCLANVSSVIQGLEHLQKIRNSIDEFLKVISDMNCIEFEKLKKRNYIPILNLIGISDTSIQAEILRVSLIRDPQQKEISIHKLLKDYPNNLHVLFLRANNALQKEEWNLALTYYSELLENYSNVSELHTNLGYAYRGLGLFDKALEEFNKANSINPAAETYTGLGLIYAENLFDYQKAKENYEEALRFNVNSGYVHYNYALFLNDDRNRFNQPQDLKKIKYHYLEAIRIYTASSMFEMADSVHYSLANLLFKVGDFNGARFHYEACLGINPKSFQAHCNYAALLRRYFGEFDLAREHYELALVINPNDVITHTNLANLLWENLGKNELADDHYKKAQKINPQYKPEVYQNFKVKTGYR